ncbi:hypothetical protein AKJ50_01475 [candidate division MSBL1 archaeon SCGC-AAA382A13]|uniref:Exosome complex component Csl4 n=1 Tax=candidate division MSBL1 archaeon SCGC-AAA382A13 TaxID=1698279 RepID=A0A133VFN1_9EURY|nr:hypothetical protein AKJ50_01475 [candidate division MSBL1 archaeon SCGC-AAA382A13]
MITEKEVKSGDFVVPGDFLATVEEFIPDEGVYEEGSNVYSSRTGIVLKDTDAKKISVHPKTDSPPILKKGDIIIGSIDRIRGQIANIEIAAIRGEERREPTFSGDAIVHISNISDDYVEEIEDELKPADIVRARVTDMGKNSAKLSIVDDSLGVLVAFCSECRSELNKEDSKLKCPNCGNTEKRKIANDYRQGIL